MPPMSKNTPATLAMFDPILFNGTASTFFENLERIFVPTSQATLKVAAVAIFLVAHAAKVSPCYS